MVSLDPQYKESWTLPTKEAFQNLIPYLKLAIPSALVCIVEYMGFELLGIISSYISVDANAALFITINMLIVIYMIAFGFSQAATTLVG